MGQQWSRGLMKVVCSVAFTVWCWVCTDKSSDNMNYSGALGQGSEPTHK